MQMNHVNIRKATEKDLEEILKIEEECFPAAEAATRESFQMRIQNFKECFWILEVEDQITTFINGVRTNETVIKDQMYEAHSIKNLHGDYLAIFGVDTRIAMQQKGYASYLMHYVIEEVKSMKLKGIILTCKKEKIAFYKSFGYKLNGKSKSVHGNAVWYDMCLVLEKG